MRPVIATCCCVGFAVLTAACQKKTTTTTVATMPPRDGTATFGQDLAFLKEHTTIELLADPSSPARVAVAPAWQGRVMTSSAKGDNGTSYGWLHYANIETGIVPMAQRADLAKHIHVFGGEERFWLGPEGGQYALFFPPAPADYTFDNWTTPAVIDTEPFELVAKSPTEVRFHKQANLVNRAKTKLAIGIDRGVHLLNRGDIAKLLEVKLPDDVAGVGYRTTNKITNTGDAAWTKDSGLVSIWLLGMFKHGPGVTVVAPLKAGPGNPVNTDYFGEVGKDRLLATDKALFFKADGAFRSKIGVPPARTNGVVGSYDPKRKTLTIVRCAVPENAADLPYVRSQWQDHKDPYAGDLINAYNDGPAKPGAAPLGPFYELETSSPAMPLGPGESLSHTQETIHFEGEPAKLDPIANAVLGVSLEEITKAVP